MNSARFSAIAQRYGQLRLAVVGDFCLDRYLEIDPARRETSIETGLPVHNVVNVRSQPGGAGTIVNNLAALGVGKIFAVGFCGEDGEGMELRYALQKCSGIRLDHFLTTPSRRTFTYCKPLLMHPDHPPEELNRLDTKNWAATPRGLESEMIKRIESFAQDLDALILLDQVDQPETGVVTTGLRNFIGDLLSRKTPSLVLADSRRGLKEFPALSYKMNLAELSTMMDCVQVPDLRQAMTLASQLGQRLKHPVFVTLAEAGIIGADATGQAIHEAAWPVSGPVDIVGAGDAVTANLTTALAAGASLAEALQAAMVAASVVIHQLGTTGTANPDQMLEKLQTPTTGS